MLPGVASSGPTIQTSEALRGCSMRQNLMRGLAVLLLLILTLSPITGVSPRAEAQGCEFVQGFKDLHDQIPDIVGDCLEDVHYVQESEFAVRDGLQATTRGLLVWRWFDNFTTFTDGFRTWVNGPFGVESRLNTELLPWEQEIQDAVRFAEEKGYHVGRAAEYNPGARLHVLTGFKVPAASGTQQNAFFFTTGGRFLGTDTEDTSAGIGVAALADDTVTLYYVLYMSEDPMCCATGGMAEVRFFFDGVKVVPLDPIPTSVFDAPGSRR